MNYVQKIINKVCQNILLHSILVLMLILPLIATLGQYISSGYIVEKADIAILYWPGFNKEFRVMLPVCITIGAMLISYVIGIRFMYKRKTLVKAIFIGLASMAVAQLVGSVFNRFTGWHEMQSISNVAKTGIMNRLILSLWHNPAWEEIVFNGIPLIILKMIKNKTSEKLNRIGLVLYYIIPSILMALYHIPNHGLARIPDTLISHMVSLLLALKYSFFAPLILHYVEDALMVISIDKVKGVPLNEINWIVQNSSILNTIFSISFISLLILIPILSIWYLKKEEKINSNPILTRRIIGIILMIFVLIGFYITNNFS